MKCTYKHVLKYRESYSGNISNYIYNKHLESFIYFLCHSICKENVNLPFNGHPSQLYLNLFNKHQNA